MDWVPLIILSLIIFVLFVIEYKESDCTSLSCSIITDACENNRTMVQVTSVLDGLSRVTLWRKTLIISLIITCFLTYWFTNGYPSFRDFIGVGSFTYLLIYMLMRYLVSSTIEPITDVVKDFIRDGSSHFEPCDNVMIL